jgi:hypothetical protein
MIQNYEGPRQHNNTIVLSWLTSKSIANFINRLNRKSCDKRSPPILLGIAAPTDYLSLSQRNDCLKSDRFPEQSCRFSTCPKRQISIPYPNILIITDKLSIFGNLTIDDYGNKRLDGFPKVNKDSFRELDLLESH